MIQNRDEICPNCGKGFLITDSTRGETICKKCGIVVEQNIIDSRAEWRSFSPEEYKKRTRVGPRSRLDHFDKGLTTVIAKENKDAFGISLTPNMRADIYRLRKWQERTKTTKSNDRNLNIAMIELDQITSQLGLSKALKESAAYIYRKTLSKGLSKGRTIKGIIIASIFIACRTNKIPITLASFNGIITIKKKTIARYIRLIQYELNIKLHPSSPKDFISYFCSELKLSGEVQSLAIKIIELAQKKGMMIGKSPLGFASGALYVACRIQHESRSQKEISKIAKITEATLRTRYKEISNLLKAEEDFYYFPTSSL